MFKYFLSYPFPLPPLPTFYTAIPKLESQFHEQKLSENHGVFKFKDLSHLDNL